MPKPKYEVIIYWSEEDQAFVAEVPELPGCAADGAGWRRARLCGPTDKTEIKRADPYSEPTNH